MTLFDFSSCTNTLYGNDDFILFYLNSSKNMKPQKPPVI